MSVCTWAKLVSLQEQSSIAYRPLELTSRLKVIGCTSLRYLSLLSENEYWKEEKNAYCQLIAILEAETIPNWKASLRTEKQIRDELKMFME